MQDFRPQLGSARSTQYGSESVLDSFRRGAIASLYTPRHEAVGPDERGPGRCDSVGRRTPARWIRQSVLADLINVKINARRLSSVAGCRGPGISLWSREQDEISSEQIQCRNLLAAPF